MKCGIVGSGAAAAGILCALSKWHPEASATIFERGSPLRSPLISYRPPTPAEYGRLYREVRRQFGLKFPPPKTHFSIMPRRRSVPDWGYVWESENWGGLTSFWGGVSLPFTDRELTGWPFTARELNPYYAAVADMVGICGCRDELRDYFGDDFVNRPPISEAPLPTLLKRSINNKSSERALGYRGLAGTARLALETRQDHPRSCNACGDCHLGCWRGAVYAVADSLEQFNQSGMISAVVRARVVSIDPRTRSLNVERNGSSESHGPFDRIYLAGGSVGSTEIVMRSFGLDEGPVMLDNAVYNFPILYTGKRPHSDTRNHVALANVIALFVPEEKQKPAAMLQVYPAFDHMWRYFVPVRGWPLFAPFGDFLRGRLLAGRLYVDGRYSQRLRFLRDGAKAYKIVLDAKPRPLDEIDGLWQALRKIIAGNGFYVPESLARLQRTSSHYGGTLPLGSGLVDSNGRIAPGIYLCDSAAFPSLPSLSPTLSIMAYACRTADQSLG